MPIELIRRLCLCHRNTWLCANWRAFLSITSYTTLSQLHIQRRCAVCFCSLWANKHSKCAASEIQIQSFKRNFFLFAALYSRWFFRFSAKYAELQNQMELSKCSWCNFPSIFPLFLHLKRFSTKNSKLLAENMVFIIRT